VGTPRLQFHAAPGQPTLTDWGDGSERFLLPHRSPRPAVGPSTVATHNPKSRRTQVSPGGVTTSWSEVRLVATGGAGPYPWPMAVDPDLVAAAMADASQYMFDAAPLGWMHREAGVLAGATGVPVPMLNGIWAESLDPDPVVVTAMLDRLDASAVPYCLQLRPGTSTKITDQAVTRGMRKEDAIPLMVLEEFSLIAQAERVDGLTIRGLEPEEGPAHIAVVADAFGMPEELFAQMMTPELLRAEGLCCYVAEAGGQPVTTGMGLTAGDFVAIFNIATPTQHRGRGYGAAVTARVVSDGRAAGAQWAWLQSSPMGYGVYERLGFRTLERWDCWVLEPDARPDRNPSRKPA